MSVISAEYKLWLNDLKGKIRSTQIKAAIAANSTLIAFYFELGRAIAEKQSKWGSKFLENLSRDLNSEFPGWKDFQFRILKRVNYSFEYCTISSQAVNQLIFQLPWGHIKLLITKIKNTEAANFYIHQTIENGWSRDLLDIQINTNLFERQGKAITNFETTLPKPMSDLAHQTLKDPYIFDFLSLDIGHREKDVENQLIQHISKFLLELGKGFAFIGNQYHIQVGENDYYIDLLFYHAKLKCYVVIELKNSKFKPEYTGKLNFYLSAIDSLIKDKTDNPTIGILLCKDKSNIEAEFALRGLNKPIGISEINIVNNIPENLKSSLPTIEEIEAEFSDSEQS